MPMTWDHEADAKLLLGILTTSNVKPDYEVLAKYMGPECTVYSIQHRFKKLRKDAGAVATTDGDSSVPATPQKRKRGRAKKDANGDAGDKEKASPKKAKKEEDGTADDDA